MSGAEREGDLPDGLSKPARRALTRAGYDEQRQRRVVGDAAVVLESVFAYLRLA